MDSGINAVALDPVCPINCRGRGASHFPGSGQADAQSGESYLRRGYMGAGCLRRAGNPGYWGVYLGRSGDDRSEAGLPTSLFWTLDGLSAGQRMCSANSPRTFSTFGLITIWQYIAAGLLI